ncbi:MAG: metallophosphoesterase [Enhygromyxa sp.]
MSVVEQIEGRLAGFEAKLAKRVRKFESEAEAEVVAEFQRLAAEAHAQAADKTAPRHPELAWVHSVLGRAEHLGHQLDAEAIVEKDGSLVGINKFEQLDPEWSLALIEYLEHRHDPAPFGDRPGHVELAARTKLAVAGDWGTGYWRGDETPASRVARHMLAGEPDWTIHLGDVYYAGTADEERQNLGEIWPRGRVGQLLLNSNHEMYSGGRPLFEGAIPQLAPQQNQTSFWSASNANWFIVGLDTAYFATDIYLKGNLGSDNPQTRWLAGLREQIGARKLIVMSHHEPVDFAGSTTTTVFDQLTQLLQRTPDYWYWGHLHNAIVYRDLPGAFTGRCIGHGSIPYGDAFGLAGLDTVEWYETQNAGDPDYEERVLCGFIELVLDGPELSERLIGEDGSVRWTASG